MLLNASSQANLNYSTRRIYYFYQTLNPLAKTILNCTIYFNPDEFLLLWRIIKLPARTTTVSTTCNHFESQRRTVKYLFLLKMCIVDKKHSTKKKHQRLRQTEQQRKEENGKSMNENCEGKLRKFASSLRSFSLSHSFSRTERKFALRVNGEKERETIVGCERIFGLSDEIWWEI